MLFPLTVTVLLVGNSVSGTVSLIDEHTFKPLGSVNVIPDLNDRLEAINSSIIHRLAYKKIKRSQVLKHFEPADGDRFIDDVFTSPDGERLFVSRSNLGDVAAFDLTQPGFPMLWRTDVTRFKADHATISPDGTRLVVSATGADEAEVLDTRDGKVVGSFNTGHFPHQNDYSENGKHIYNGSIGDVTMSHAQNARKGDRLLTVVDAASLEVVKTYQFDYGVRPTVISADEKTMYAQLSYLNGLIKFDLTSGAITKQVTEPFSSFASANYPTPDDYPHDSAHHGLALSGDGTKLCDAGTIDNNVAIVDTASLSVSTVIDVGLIPYWATTSADGRYCFVSVSGANVVSVIDYAAEKEVARVPVDKFPQRNRNGQIVASALTALAAP